MGMKWTKAPNFSVNSSNDKYQYWRGTTSKYYSNHQNMNMLSTALLESGELGFLLITKKKAKFFICLMFTSFDVMLVMPLLIVDDFCYP